MAESDYSTSSVYREEGTGKIRVKAATHIADVTESPADAGDIAAKVNEILALLTAAGINSDA